MLDSARAPITGKKVQMRLQDYVGIAGGELLLKEHLKGQYAEYVEANTYSIFQDGVLQSALSPICVPDPTFFSDSGLPLIGGIVSTFGDGSDGDKVVDVDENLPRDMYYHDLYIYEDSILYTYNWRIFVSGTLYLYGTISNSGHNASNQGGGAATPAGFYPSYGAGPSGGDGGLLGSQGLAGGGGSNTTQGILGPAKAATGYGGAGGDRDNHTPPPGGVGGNPGAAGSFAYLPMWSVYQSLETGMTGRIFTLSGLSQFKLYGSPGAGAGGGSGTPGPGGLGDPGAGGAGGGTGADGGIIGVFARKITSKSGLIYPNGFIVSNGGLSGNGTSGGISVNPYGGFGGGGGEGNGGNGGIIYVATIDPPAFGWSVSRGGSPPFGGPGKGAVQTNPLPGLGFSGNDGTKGNEGYDGKAFIFRVAP